MTATILICDNEEPLRALVRASLDGDGHELLEARDGDEALALAREARPDLIVLDMMMPGRTGIDVLRDLRADPSFAHTSVIMLTARAQVADRAAAAEAGADRVLATPFSPLELGALVDELLSSRA
jgi:DNA-binding response OmpR family regulator